MSVNGRQDVDYASEDGVEGGGGVRGGGIPLQLLIYPAKEAHFACCHIYQGPHSCSLLAACCHCSPLMHPTPCCAHRW